MASMSSLQDSFAVNDLAALWGLSSAGVTISGGFAQIPCTSSYPALESGATYDLTGSYAAIQVTPSQGSDRETYLECNLSSTNKIDLFYSGGNLTARLTQAGTATSGPSVTYDPVAHAWWRIRESGGVLHWETSADGVHWSQLWTSAYTLAITALSAIVTSGFFSTDTASTTFVDAFNVFPPVFPQSPLDAQVDMQIGGTWTPITPYALQRAGTSPPITITRGRPNESANVNSATLAAQINNRDGRFSVKNPTGPYYGRFGRNTPIRVSVPAQTTHLRFETDATSYVSTPDAAGLDITGDTEIQIDLRLTDFRPCLIASKYISDAAGVSWELGLVPGGFLQFQFYDGTNYHLPQSTVPLPLGRLTIRVTLQVNNGSGGWTVTFYTGPAGGLGGSSWTQLGAPVTGTPTVSVHTCTAPLVIGYVSGYASDSGGLNGCLGAVYGLRLLSGIGGTVKASPDFTAQTPGAASFTDAQGNVWSLNGTAELSGRSYRFHGESSSLPVAWDTSGKDVWVPLAAGGILRRLGQGNAPISSPMRRAILSRTGTLAPHAYWPCEDLSGATSIGSAVGGPLMTVLGTANMAADSSFLASLPLPTLNGSGWYGVVPSYTSNGNVVVRFLLKMGTPLAGTLVRVITTGTCTQFVLQGDESFVTGGLRIIGYNSGGATIFDSGGFGSPAPGSSFQGYPVWVSMELRPAGGGNVNASVDYLAPGGNTAYGATYGTYSGTVGNVTAVYVAPGQNFTDTVVGHISVQSGWETMFDLQQPLSAWAGEAAGNRFVRLCSENGIAARVIGAPDVTVPMGAQSAQTLQTLLQEIEDADRGQIFEPRQALGLGYRTQASMLNQAAAVTLDYSQAQLGGTGTALQPTYDDQYTKNDVTLQRSSGSVSGAVYRATLNDGSSMSVSPPPTGVGDYVDSKTVNVQADTQLPDEAGWIIHVLTVDEARWPAIPVNMARAAVSGIYYAVLTSDIGDFAGVVNPPAQLPPDEIKQLIWGVKENLGGYHFTIEWNAVPESPYEVAVFGDAVYGRADTDGSTLNAGASAAATSLSVAATDTTDPLWTTSAADFPFDIMVGGERMTVTNITGTTSPQTFTVTRSVNGVVKSQAAGTDVRLWFPPILAMI